MNNGTSKATVIPELSNGEKCPSLHSALTSPVTRFRLLSRPRVDTRADCATLASDPQASINSTPICELNSISVIRVLSVVVWVENTPDFRDFVCECECCVGLVCVYAG